METSEDARLDHAVAALNDLIALMRRLQLEETAQFLAMAKLNLLMAINGITDAELRALSAALENDMSGARRTRRRANGKRQPRGRAGRTPPAAKIWIGADGLATLRAARVKQ